RSSQIDPCIAHAPLPQLHQGVRHPTSLPPTRESTHSNTIVVNSACCKIIGNLLAITLVLNSREAWYVCRSSVSSHHPSNRSRCPDRRIFRLRGMDCCSCRHPRSGS